MIYGSFWRRAAAHLIDTFITVVVSVFAIRFVMLRLAPIGPTDSYAEYWDTLSPMIKALWVLMAFAYSWPYYAFLESSSLQATIGKMQLSLKVTDLEGKKITIWRASGRFCARRFFWYFGFLGTPVSAAMVAFTITKQSLHDKIAKTFVVRSDTQV